VSSGGGASPPQGRWSWILTTAGVSLALTGAAVEIFHGTSADAAEAVAWRPPARQVTADERAAEDANTPPAPTYKTLPDKRLGPNARWKPHLTQLQSDKPKPPLKEPAERAAALKKSLAERAERRAYDGAPPVIPHAVDQQAAANCLACHEKGLTVASRPASVRAHRSMTNCVQCHTTSTNRKVPPSSLVVVNSWRGLQPAGKGGPRAWKGAPPLIPHSTLLRDNCISCHGPWGRPGLRTPHPERVNCVQCHVRDATLDQVRFAAHGRAW